ncbi:hypothetical protein RRG08_022009 [Elysia crispata]|uniref:Uncharacterized protein n=1 Tax=Elysia crispata TaxID=231223 RepID=A0AAE1A8K0_9GAST|nr:hypothetical protein RRG08_022009 [Elysia crispata]
MKKLTQVAIPIAPITQHVSTRDGLPALLQSQWIKELGVLWCHPTGRGEATRAKAGVFVTGISRLYKVKEPGPT